MAKQKKIDLGHMTEEEKMKYAMELESMGEHLRICRAEGL